MTTSLPDRRRGLRARHRNLGLRLAGPCLAALFHAGSAVAFELPSTWESAHFRDNALVGTIHTGAGELVEPSDLKASIAGADYVLAGETHDNADHHLLQARLIEVMAGSGQRPAVVFEMIPEDLQPAVDTFLASSPPDAGGFGAVVRWEERGWPDFAIYRPVFQAAISADLPIRAGDLPRDVIRKIGREGTGALAPEELSRLSLDGDLPPEQTSTLSATLKESHCGLLPDAAVAPMLTAQRARDGALADALSRGAQEAGDGKAVLIAGSGHVRKDWAVPPILAARMPEARIVSIAMLEVSEGEELPADYGLDPSDPAPFDYVIFTPRGNVSDPCEGMAEAFGRHGEETKPPR